MFRTVVAVSLLLATVACGEDEGRILVDLKTDYVSGEEFASVRTSLFTALPGSDDAPLATEARSAVFGQDYLGGTRVAELSLLGSGTAVLRTELLDADGVVTAERVSRIAVASGNTGVTVLISRDCVGVVCPGSGPAVTTECFGGSCVSPDCVEESSESCGATECASDSECTSPVACAAGRCVAGQCLFEGVAAGCGSGEYCDPSMGCRTRTSPDAGLDAGTDGGLDAGDATVDATDAVVAPDASGPGAVCPGTDPATVALYLLDGVTGADTLPDERGSNPGRLSDTGPTFTPGPDPVCGNALTFGAGNRSFAIIDDATDWDIAPEGSVDFWINIDPGVVAVGSRGIVSRAAFASTMDGTLEVGLEGFGRIFVYLSGTSGDSVLCTEAPVDDRSWHHVGINFGGPGTELWLDNVLQNGAGPIDVSFPPGTLICGTVTPTATIAGNDYPWVIGASNKESSPGTTDGADNYVETTAIDHLRISSARRDFSTLPPRP